MDTMDNMDTIVHGQMDYIRNRIDKIVDDPSTAEGLKPWYRQVSLCSYTYIHTCIHTWYRQVSLLARVDYIQCCDGVDYIL